MNLNPLLRTLFLAIALGAPTAGALAQEFKIGFVNSERVMRESNLAKAAQAKLEAEFGRRERELRDAAARLQASAEKLEKDGALLSESERTRRQRELVETERDLQRKRREFQEDAQARRNEELQAVVERANKVIKQIFEQEKYDLILQDAIHASARIDITKKVIDALNAQK
ncbi:MAG: OmpH family outer membrane protein [Burkholderiales bacterium]